MKCKICGNSEIQIIYKGKLKTGSTEGWTEKEYEVFQCQRCKVIWNLGYKEYDFADYYESDEYRTKMEEDTSIEAYCEKYDKAVLDKLRMTGTGIFRNKIVADIGCGGGSFLDFIGGVSKTSIAIEPSLIYREGLCKKGHEVFAYATEAMNKFKNSIDVITSFDVIEHVENPKAFLKDAYDLCSDGGQIVIGTPTDYPILRKMLGDVFDRFIFQIQHPWIFSDEAMKLMAEEVGFKNIRIEYWQKYGIGNLLSWLLDEKPRGDIHYDFIEETLDIAYRKSMSKKDVCEYIILYAEKIKM